MQLVSTQMASQASSTHFFKDRRKKWQVIHGPVVLQHPFISRITCALLKYGGSDSISDLLMICNTDRDQNNWK